jgi:phospholipid transport system substrate-binding protein
MRRITCTSLLALLTFASVASAAPEDDAITKPLKGVIGSIRQSRDLAALKFFAAEEQGKLLLGEDWAKGTDAQRKEFLEGFKTLFAKLAFPKVRQNFENLDTILYDPPKVEGDRAQVSSIVRINHPMKKQELKLKYKVLKEKDGWRVIDVSVLGDSMLEGIREEQIIPIMKEGGWDALLKAMRAKLAEPDVAKVKLK